MTDALDKARRALANRSLLAAYIVSEVEALARAVAREELANLDARREQVASLRNRVLGTSSEISVSAGVQDPSPPAGVKEVRTLRWEDDPPPPAGKEGEPPPVNPINWRTGHRILTSALEPEKGGDPDTVRQNAGPKSRDNKSQPVQDTVEPAPAHPHGGNMPPFPYQREDADQAWIDAQKPAPAPSVVEEMEMALEAVRRKTINGSHFENALNAIIDPALAAYRQKGGGDG